LSCSSLPSFTSTGDWKGFFRAVESIANQQCPTPSGSSFIFSFTKEAAEHNSKILADFDFDLGKAIEAQGFSHLSMGSELRPLDQLLQLFAHHPFRQEIADIASQGVDYPADDLPEETRIDLVEAQLAKGNQDSALEPEALPLVTKQVIDDVEKGYAIPVSIDCLRKLKDGEVYPLGIAHQLSINELGEIVPKKRLTHNLSNKKNLGLSINQRVREDELPPTQFGFALLRFLHAIHNIRLHNPGERILCNKVDIEKAYRRLQTTAKIASKCCSTWHLHVLSASGDSLASTSDEEIGSILTRLPFGSSPGPAMFSCISESTFDLARDLMECELWDPAELPPPLHETVPPPRRLDSDIPFGEALEVAVSLPPDAKGALDGYIDDAFAAVLDTHENAPMVHRTALCSLMSLHLTCRPLDPEHEPVPRPHVASKKKLEAEGALAELITVLGWYLDTRRFTIALPDDKEKAWAQSIIDILGRSEASFKELETLVGRLDHVCYIIPAARHFMNRLRRVKYAADKRCKASLSSEVKKDLFLWIKFLRRAKMGISINNVVFRTPTCIPLTDASEIGIGGYSLTSNTMWRYQFSIEEQISFSLNVKEYIAASIGAYLELQNDESQHPCVLSLGDSSSTTSWLHKSNHDPASSPVHNAISRWHAGNLITFDACDYSQHIAGSENWVADSLSRDFHLTDAKLMCLLHSCVAPELLPRNPQLISLPTALTSWIASLALLQPKKRELRWQPKPSTIAAGVAGWNFASGPKSPVPIWKDTPPSIKPESYAHSWTEFGVGSSRARIPLRETPRERPSTMWQRQSNLVVGETLGSTEMAQPTS
jgi:hypothetical protein